ncbi:hypothetical protein G7046_g9334 [Stylonectria norvegica]|nr:hypothetical protein G7046_g9334 [Stylonectria norvegica]
MADAEVIVAAVALVVSLVALIATFMQVLQQYYASATGYSQCNQKVMGRWADTKKRSFSWEELRFEVEFYAPVIFVSPPSNKNGPVSGEPIYFLEGTPESLENTWTELTTIDKPAEFLKKTPKEQIHTADNERASWTILLSAIQRMEKDSRSWQQLQHEARGPPAERSRSYDLPSTPPSLRDHHTLTVALQRQRKSWDTVPKSINRPYATSTICHLVEMMAALGVYWKEFDRTRDRYRAEGNGFMVLGERLSDLGLVFSFQVYGKCRFEGNRVIPVDEIKELCFGYVPTIYRETLDQRRLEFPNDEPQNLSSLQMASQNDIAESLVLIGCNNNTVQYFTGKGKRTSHLFPISFEILGMLSRTFHIENSVFTYIPNPTPDRWDKRSLSLIKILESYQELVSVPLLGAERNPSVLAKLTHHIRQILLHQDSRDITERLCFLRALHEALDDCDEILTAKSRASRNTDEANQRRPTALKRDKSADKLPKESPETTKQERRREAVQDVLRSHIQECLRLLNDRDDRNADGQSLHADWSPSHNNSRHQDVTRSPDPRFEDMNAASPDDRQHKFMEVYFIVVRRNVVPHATSSTDRRTSITGPPPGYGFRRAGTGRTQASGSIRDTESVMPPLPTSLQENGVSITISTDRPLTNGPAVKENSPSSEKAEDDAETVTDISLADQEVSHDDIWCTLVFRMICWLMLHDFNKLDVQLNKSELLGSRMPVYIT